MCKKYKSLVSVDGSKEGRTFEGIGAVSAGASSRLLMDYSQPYRSQILHYLFKPNYGASFQHLKVEIGADANSTDGTEPSHARTRSELNNPQPSYYQRGYEYWLMKEAKNRNSSIYLDCLEWGAPGWIGNGNFYSQDNIDYMIAFLKGAKTYYNLDMNYIGIWNETTSYSTTALDFIKNLRSSLNTNSLNNIKIVANDENTGSRWYLADYMKNDPVLKNAVGAIGVHYPNELGLDIGRTYANSSANAQSLGVPLYSSEDGPWNGSWDGAKGIARLTNRNYINQKITKTELRSPVSAYYDALPIPGSGVMYANQPWSGNYEIQPATWAVAHTTQFAQPGWKYIDSGCGLLNNGADGSYVTMKSPDGSGDYSIIIETTDDTASQNVTFNLSNLSLGAVHVWMSNETSQFIQQSDIKASGSSTFTITLQPGSIYSLTTTTGQKKGNAGTPPAKADFPSTYSDDFESYNVGQLPKYTSDQIRWVHSRYIRLLEKRNP